MSRLARRKYRDNGRLLWMIVTLEEDDAGYWVCSFEWTDEAASEAGSNIDEIQGTTSERRFDTKENAWNFISEIEGLKGWVLVGSQGERNGLDLMPIRSWPTKEEAEIIAERLDNSLWFYEQPEGSMLKLIVDDGENGGLSAVTKSHHRSIIFAFAQQACKQVLKRSGFDRPQLRADMQEPKKLLGMLKQLGLSPGKIFLNLWQNANEMRNEAVEVGKG